MVDIKERWNKPMKRVLSLLLIFCLTLSLAACGNTESPSSASGSSPGDASAGAAASSGGATENQYGHLGRLCSGLLLDVPEYGAGLGEGRNAQALG